MSEMGVLVCMARRCFPFTMPLLCQPVARISRCARFSAWEIVHGPQSVPVFRSRCPFCASPWHKKADMRDLLSQIGRYARSIVTNRSTCAGGCHRLGNMNDLQKLKVAVLLRNKLPHRRTRARAGTRRRRSYSQHTGNGTRYACALVQRLRTAPTPAHALCFGATPTPARESDAPHPRGNPA